MSVRCITNVLDHSAHSGTELLMLVVLADYSDDDGNSYPGVASLARKCRMTSRNANYLLKALQDSGELRVLKNEGPRGTNRYRIMLSLLGSSKPLKHASPLKGIAPLKPASCPSEAHFLKPLKPTSDEPSLNRQEPSSSKTAPTDFDVFYKAYPKKVGKVVAAKAFVKAKATANLDTILADICRRQSSGEWTADKMQFIPHPSTYLNGKRWQDETGVSEQMPSGGILPGAL